MLEKMLAMIRERDLCVLATAGPEGPHASLMSYLTAEEGRVLYLLTLKDSRKFANLINERRVSLLIDDRDAPDGSTGRGVRALTLAGQAGPLPDREVMAQVLERFRGKLPHLIGLADHPQVAVIEVRLQSLMLLDGPLDAHFVELD